MHLIRSSGKAPARREPESFGRHRRGARKKALPDLRRLQEDQSGLCGIIQIRKKQTVSGVDAICVFDLLLRSFVRGIIDETTKRWRWWYETDICLGQLQREPVEQEDGGTVDESRAESVRRVRVYRRADSGRR